MKKKTCCVSFLLLMVLALQNQQVLGQTISASPYSVYGVGLLKSRTSAHNRSLATTGIGIRDGYNLNTLNPASYTSLLSFTQLFELGFYYEADQFKTTNLSQDFSTGNLTAINYWFRFSPKWAGTIGLAPYSNVTYNILSDQNFGTEDEVPVQYAGNGGLTQFYFGNGIRLTKNLSVGLTGYYTFGNITKNETIVSGQSAGIGVSNEISVNRLSVDFGTQYSFQFAENRSLTLGLTYNPKLRLNTARKISVFETAGDSLAIAEKEVNDYVLPSEIGAGISFQTSRSLIAADLSYKIWDDAVVENNLQLRNTLRASLGYEYKGNPKATNYWEFIMIRSGFYVQQNYLVLKNSPFNEWGFTLGLGLPVSDNRGTISVSYNYNQSGTTANKLIAQTAHVLVLDLAIRDLWFIKRKFD